MRHTQLGLLGTDTYSAFSVHSSVTEGDHVL